MSHLTFTQALEHAAMLATQALPETLHERLRDAVLLVRDGHCFQQDGGSWSVASASDPTKTYTNINGHCDCDDARFNHPHKGLCKHRLSVYLSRKTQALLTVAQTGAAPELGGGCATTPVNSHPPQPLYEAPSSVNCHLVIDGRDCQLTLRDSDEARLLGRLTVVLQRYPQPPPAPQVSSQGEGWCSKHGQQMTQTTKDGRSWWSHRYDGQWCKGK
jgi:hypothetical protein